MKESYFDRHIPTDQYGFSKYIMTKYMQHSKNIYNLRLFGVFGKYDDWRYRFIPNACCRALLGRPIVIRQNKMFDFMYIDDLVEIVKWIILAQPIENIYNVCSGRALELKAIAKTIVEVSGKQSEIICLESQLASEYSGDNALLLSELKDFRFYGIEQAIQNLYDWYASNVSLICEDQLC